jgi:hypothetical protein
VIYQNFQMKNGQNLIVIKIYIFIFTTEFGTIKISCYLFFNLVHLYSENFIDYSYPKVYLISINSFREIINRYNKKFYTIKLINICKSTYLFTFLSLIWLLEIYDYVFIKAICIKVAISIKIQNCKYDNSRVK